MAKKLRREPIYIAPDISGWLDESYVPNAFDERTNEPLDPTNPYHKIFIYERQVFDWFLNPAKKLVTYKNKNKGFIALMICLSYIEGVEQYRKGESSDGQSRAFFIASMQRLYPGKFHDRDLRQLYSEARCGLFHTGMVRGKIIISYRYTESLSINHDNIKINPRIFLDEIITDFNGYIQELKTSEPSRTRFSNLYSNVQ